MYGVPARLDLSFLNGAVLIQVCLGQYQVQFRFQPGGSICVEGRWELTDLSGKRIDQSHNGIERPPYQLHRLLGARVNQTQVSGPKSIALQFDCGMVLRIFDDSKQFESFQVEPGGIIV